MADKWSVAQHCESSGRKANDTPGFSKSTSGILCLLVASQTKRSMSREGCLPGEEQAKHRSVQSSAG